MARELSALHIEFPSGHITTFISNLSHPTEKDYIVERIESEEFGSTVRVISKNTKGHTKEEYFANVPYVLKVEDI